MATNNESILTEMKKVLGVGESVEVFDADIRMHINSAFGTLHQLGVGPSGGFEVTDDSQTWADVLLTDLPLNPVKSYIYLRVKLLFDPPANSWNTVAIKEQLEELTWRISEAREAAIPVPERIPTWMDEEELAWWRSWHGNSLDGGVI